MPKGPTWIVDQGTKDEILRRVRANGDAGVEPSSVAALARVCGVTPPALSTMLKKRGDSNSRLLPQMCAALGMPVPSSSAFVDQHRAHILAEWENLTPEDHELVRTFVDRLADKRSR